MVAQRMIVSRSIPTKPHRGPTMTLLRRTLLSRSAALAAGVAAPAFLSRYAFGAAEFAYKYGTALPEGHPMVIRSKEAAAKIKEESGGRAGITFYGARWVALHPAF